MQQKLKPFIHSRAGSTLNIIRHCPRHLLILYLITCVSHTSSFLSYINCRHIVCLPKKINADFILPLRVDCHMLFYFLQLILCVFLPPRLQLVSLCLLFDTVKIKLLKSRVLRRYYPFRCRCYNSNSSS